MSLELKQVRKSFKQAETQIEVLRGINFSVNPGEIVAIVGQSGSGKSTLLSLLAGLDQPDSGEIHFLGKQMNQLNQDQLTRFRAQNIGIVFQQFHLLSHLTALENVMVPLEILSREQSYEKIKQDSIEALQSLGMGHRMDHLPAKLSGGESQRVAIARAMVTKPSLLLADEPSGNLDIETGKLVMDVFFQVARQKNSITLLVTHSPELAARCDRQLHLQRGVI